jgi:hypothetical protein
MCCAEAGDPISTDSNAAAPKNRVLVILFLLIIDPSTWAVGEQDRHFRDNIPGKHRRADHASAILYVVRTRTLDRRSNGILCSAETQNIENNPMQSSPR